MWSDKLRKKREKRYGFYEQEKDSQYVLKKIKQKGGWRPKFLFHAFFLRIKNDYSNHTHECSFVWWIEEHQLNHFEKPPRFMPWSNL